MELDGIHIQRNLREACLTRRDSAEKCARRMRPGPWPRGCAFGAGVSCLYLRCADLSGGPILKEPFSSIAQEAV